MRVEEPTYSVTYGVYYNDSDKEPQNIKEAKENYSAQTVKGHSCFSSLSKKIYAYHEKTGIIPNRLFYESGFHLKSNLETAEKWLTLCKKHNMIPKDIKIKNLISDGNLYLKIDGMKLNQIYVYLCSVRYLYEYPTFVKAVLHLVDIGFDFMVAFVVSAQTIFPRNIHSITPDRAAYSPEEDITKKTFHVINALKLKKLISENAFSGKTVKDGVFNDDTFCIHENLISTDVNILQKYGERLKFDELRRAKIYKTGKLVFKRQFPNTT